MTYIAETKSCYVGEKKLFIVQCRISEWKKECYVSKFRILKLWRLRSKQTGLHIIYEHNHYFIDHVIYKALQNFK